MGVQYTGTKPKNFAEIDLVNRSTDQTVGRRSIDVMSMVSLDPRYVLNFGLNLCTINAPVEGPSTYLWTVDEVLLAQKKTMTRPEPTCYIKIKPFTYLPTYFKIPSLPFPSLYSLHSPLTPITTPFHFLTRPPQP